LPSKSAKQHRFMEAAAHSVSFAKRAGISQRVAREFVAADAHKPGGYRARTGSSARTSGR